MAAEPEFPFLFCRAAFAATRPLSFQTPAANLFRGCLGFALPEAVFRPVSPQGPSGFRDRPRPFSLRCHHLDGAHLLEGQPFEITLHLFSPQPEPFRQALSSLSFARLTSFEVQPRTLALAPPSTQIRAVHLEFSTPTELKPPVPRGQLPQFPVLMARVRDRISSLLSFYSPGAAAFLEDFDFAGFAQRAAHVSARRGQIDWLSASRTSRRTGQTHPLSGITGWADYHGPLTEFLPWLSAGEVAGVGRHTVWGNGVIRVLVIESPDSIPGRPPVGPSADCHPR
ncbi:MAG: CRISPR system precrRNA processing endoribonuclease RAMP protein Cas6 [Acidobacteria bacterium]|nr:CRISPR system precrRNA processing endoribonuclease RAMP protein Cas6 [Acidobacteriota bacterium]